MNKSIEYLIKEMCKRVKADFTSINFSEDQWYYKYEWTEEECNKYKKWLEKTLWKNKKIRQDLGIIKDKKHIHKVVQFFNLNYGWRIKEIK